jgi:hypothetical protein
MNKKHIAFLDEDQVLRLVPVTRSSPVQIGYPAAANSCSSIALFPLVLSIPATPSEDDNGLVTASEVATLKLNADFVVLSACNTAAPDKPGAEALSGLARAFFYAGAKSLVVSHWTVDSDATVKLIDGLFAALKANPGLSHARRCGCRCCKSTIHNGLSRDSGLHL